MGLFHCPLGVLYYDCDGCIDCGMCLATNKEEMIQASKIVREYLKEQHKAVGEIKKIALCGKGGVGKSTILALLASIFIEQGFSVLIFDTDESNPGLSRLCGLNREPLPLMDLLGQAPEGDKGQAAGWGEKDRITIEEIPTEYIVESDQLKFLMVGKIEDPFQGCACSMADITRDLVGKLELKEKEILLIDTEAGVESFGRGVERSVDTVLSIVEPSYQSIALAVRIHYMAQGMGVGRVRTILNKVGSEENRTKMLEALKNKNIPVLGAVCHDIDVNEAGFEGRALGGDSRAKNDLKEMVSILLAEAFARTA